MANKEENFNNEITPVESQRTEIMQTIQDDDPETQLAILEKKAELAPRFTAAVNKILISQTSPDDWSQHDDKVCLSSAGSERVARSFGIKFFDCKQPQKEEFTDSKGKGYRYVCEGYASMGSKIVWAQGSYGTRDKFLGKKGGEFKPIEDINENDIRNAAYHIFTGNAIKALLGIRAIPKIEFDKIMKEAGRDTSTVKNASYGKGNQGGTTADDTAQQQELSKILIDFANAGQLVTVDDDGHYHLDETEVFDALETAQSSCLNLTSFIGRDKKMVKGIDNVKILKGQRLEIALNNAKKLKGA